MSKTQIHRRLVHLGIVEHLPTEKEERADPAHADELYQVCSDRLRRKALELKSKSPFDIVHSENISYGFRRNILGIKPYGLMIVVVAFIVTITAFLFDRHPLIELIGIAILAAYLYFGVTEAAMKRVADEYSKRLLDAVQSLQLQDGIASGSRRQPTSTG